ncbi:uncharacterized protein LOC106706426 isoform X1 [Latimeria chalumnae]|uniref:uncharacterized protein LOC106706426 isoform X1 n=2 Tax=Latimeria chalumnae TaxID=7897 RepID=UPI00313A7BC3
MTVFHLTHVIFEGVCRMLYPLRCWKMATLHWESRRRQRILDRRMANRRELENELAEIEASKLKCEKENKAKSHAMPDNTGQGTAGQGTAGQGMTDQDYFPDDEFSRVSSNNYSAKIKNRYTSVKYLQQW